MALSKYEWYKTLKMFMGTELCQHPAFIQDALTLMEEHSCTSLQEAWSMLIGSRPWIAMDILDALDVTELVDFHIPTEFNSEYDELASSVEEISDSPLRALLKKYMTLAPVLPSCRAMTTDIPDEEQGSTGPEILEDEVEEVEEEERPRVEEDEHESQA